MLMPTIADSEMGVSTTRISPNSSCRPCVTPKAPPYAPTSSPRTKTFGSRRISSASASLIASRYESSLGIQIPDRILRNGIRRVHRELDGLIDRRGDAPFDLRQRLVVEDVPRAQVGRERRNRIAALPHRKLFVGPVERLVVLGVAAPAVGLAFNQRRTAAVARARDRAERRLIDGE